MKLLLALPIVAGTILFSQYAHAQARPDVRNFTCEQAKQFIKQSGAVVVTTGPRTYKRVVTSQRFCQMSERTRFFFTETRGGERCNIGRICIMTKSGGV